MLPKDRASDLPLFPYAKYRHDLEKEPPEFPEKTTAEVKVLRLPYQRTMRHPFAWITCGIWRQGLVQKNKGEIARVLGEQVATKLLQPEKIADDLCSMIGSVLRNERVVVSIRNGVQRLITSHDKEIAAQHLGAILVLGYLFGTAAGLSITCRPRTNREMKSYALEVQDVSRRMPSPCF